MGGRRKGLILLWTQLCIFLVMSMALGALCMMRTAITREEACERAAGRIYLAQEVMEKIKYKEKTSGSWRSRREPWNGADRYFT